MTAEFCDVKSDDLRFLRAEAAQFLYNRCGTQLNRAAIDTLLDKTEGWPPRFGSWP